MKYEDNYNFYGCVCRYTCVRTCVYSPVWRPETTSGVIACEPCTLVFFSLLKTESFSETWGLSIL